MSEDRIAKPIHPTYLPFTEEELRSHLPKEKQEYLAYYVKSAGNYDQFLARRAETLTDDERLLLHKGERLGRQIEKDERFWIAACLMTFYHHRAEKWPELLARCFGNKPPDGLGFTSWAECFRGPLHLVFEESLPAPETYRRWMREHLTERHFIPYVLEAGERSIARLEGQTHPDALLIDEASGFAIVFECKVTSDVSCQVTFDLLRNQIARNVDVMLEPAERIRSPLNLRRADRTVFVLLTPRLFRDNPRSRLYSILMREYKDDPVKLAEDLPHRREQELNWSQVAGRLGWLTWEDCRDISPESCPWVG
jgi:hypothetical protein